MTRMAIDTTSAAHLVDATGMDVSASAVIECCCVVKLAWCDVLLWIDETRGEAARFAQSLNCRPATGETTDP